MEYMINDVNNPAAADADSIFNGKIKLSEIVDMPALQSLTDEFYVLTGMPIGILDLDGKSLINSGWQDICTNFHRVNPETLRCCIESNTIRARGISPGECREYRCLNNMQDIVTPLMCGGRHIGNIVMGQFLYDDDEAGINEFKEQAAMYGFDEDEYLEALARVPRCSRDRVKKLMRFYVKLADMISQMGLSNLILAMAIEEKDRTDEMLEKRESLLRIITDNMVDMVFMMDTDMRFRYISPSLERVVGYRSEELMGRDAIEYVHPDDREMIINEVGRLLIEGTGTAEYRYRGINGDYLWFESKGKTLTGPDGSVTGAVVGSRDITSRKKAEMEIQQLLEQKEMLLREVHHRIKNNMNTIAGLLKLQSMSINENAAVEALNDARGRVLNMMLVYDRLYRSADYRNLQVKGYFDELIREIIRIFPNNARVKVTSDIEDFRLDSKILFTMGIMINELITNAFKYAFDGIEYPELFFKMVNRAGKITFSVRDNGTGLPQGVLNGERQGFGLNLVAAMAEQLEGEMSFTGIGGTGITVSFTPVDQV